MRNNPGGLLEEAVTVSDAFLERGEIVSTRGRNAEETQRRTAHAGRPDQGQAGDRADQRRLGLGVRNRRRRAAGPQARDADRHPLVRQGLGADHHPARQGNGALRLTTARYFTPSGKSIQAKGIVPDIEVLQDVPDELKSRTDTKGEASLRGHLKTDGDEKTGSQSYVPPDAKDDKALKMAADLLHGIKVNRGPGGTGDKAAIDKPANKAAN